MLGLYNFYFIFRLIIFQDGAVVLFLWMAAAACSIATWKSCCMRLNPSHKSPDLSPEACSHAELERLWTERERER